MEFYAREVVAQREGADAGDAMEGVRTEGAMSP